MAADAGASADIKAQYNRFLTRDDNKAYTAQLQTVRRGSARRLARARARALTRRALLSRSSSPR
jgi:hypothetical protein